MSNCFGINHKETNKLVYTCQYTKKWSEVKISKRNFVLGCARWLVPPLHFQTNQSARASSIICLCGICEWNNVVNSTCTITSGWLQNLPHYKMAGHIVETSQNLDAWLASKINNTDVWNRRTVSEIRYLALKSDASVQNQTQVSKIGHWGEIGYQCLKSDASVQNQCQVSKIEH